MIDVLIFIVLGIILTEIIYFKWARENVDDFRSFIGFKLFCIFIGFFISALIVGVNTAIFGGFGRKGLFWLYGSILGIILFFTINWIIHLKLGGEKKDG